MRELQCTYKAGDHARETTAASGDNANVIFRVLRRLALAVELRENEKYSCSVLYLTSYASLKPCLAITELDKALLRIVTRAKGRAEVKEGCTDRVVVISDRLAQLRHALHRRVLLVEHVKIHSLGPLWLPGQFTAEGQGATMGFRPLSNAKPWGGGLVCVHPLRRVK